MSEGGTAARAIRVLLVEDHLVLAESLAALLEKDAAIDIAGITTTASEALAIAREVAPDVLLVDLGLPDGSGAEVAAAIRRHGERPAIVFLTGDESSEALAQAIEAGGGAYISKAAAPEVVAEAIKRVFAGEMLIRPDQVLRALNERRAAQRRDRERAAILQSLTPSEREILSLLAAGRDASSIARERRISVLTVRAHVRSLLSKLEAHSQLEAVSRAQAMGILDVPPPAGRQ